MKKNRIRLTESQLHRAIKESVGKILSEMSGNDIALINGSCGDNPQTFIEYLEELGLPENDATMYRGHFPQHGNWLRGIHLLKRANAWNEQTKAEYKEMIEHFFEYAKYAYEVGIEMLERYG